MSYTEITEKEFEYTLSHLGKSGYTWKRLEEKYAKENVYMVSINDIHLKIFSSIVGGTSRGVGNDAIRVVGWDNQSDRPMSVSEGRVNRTDNWSENLKSRIQTVVSKVVEIRDAPKCPKCGGMMSEMKGKYGKFMGCLNYKNHGKEPSRAHHYVNQLNDKIIGLRLEISTCGDNNRIKEIEEQLKKLEKDQLIMEAQL